MKNRRQFMKEVAAGAAILGAQSTLALGGASASTRSTEKSRVVVVDDPKLRENSVGPDAKRVSALLDRAMQTFYRRENPVEPWKRLVGSYRNIGLKVNTIAGKGLSTHVSLVDAICERLQQAGIQAGNIIIWDRTNRELETAGFKISTDSTRVRCFGSDSIGYEDLQLSHGTVNTRLSKILTQHCDLVINVPILKDHEMAGVTLAMKNMYGVIQNPQDQHGGGCNPYVADLNMIPSIRNKVRFVIADAFTGQYEGGPGFKPQYTWNHDTLIVGQDPVAVDHVGWQIIERKRAEMKLKTLEQAGRPPRYIQTAADAQHQLGTNDPSRIALTHISIA
jgi:uncharacterized protein (DUF362 family)